MTDNQTDTHGIADNPMSDFMRSILEDKDYNPNMVVELTDGDFEEIVTSHMNAITPPAYKPRMITRDIDPSKVNLNRIQQYSVKYSLKDEQLQKLKAMCPTRYFRYEPKSEHDHPISHILTDINEEDLLMSYKGERFVDLFGNANRNKALKVNSTCYRGFFTGKDYIRALTEPDSVRDFVSINHVIKENVGVKKYFCMHAMYYMDVEQIAQIVYSGSKVVFDAIVHRHSKVQGDINGENKYVVDSDGIVTQVTPIGEIYRHKTLEPFFNQWEARTTKGVIAWTASKLYGDSYLLRFTACPGYNPSYALPELYYEQDVKPQPQVLLETQEFESLTLFGHKWLRFKTNNSIVLHDYELYEDLRKYVTAKPRNAQTKKDLTHYARRLVDKKDLFAKHADSYHDIPSEHLIWYVEAAFHADIQTECDATLTMRRKYKNALLLHDKLHNNPTEMNDTVLGAIKETAVGVSKALSDVSTVIMRTSDMSGTTFAVKAIASGFTKSPIVQVLKDNVNTETWQHVSASRRGARHKGVK